MRYLSLRIFLEKWFKFQSYACSECHESLMMPINLNGVAVLNRECVDYCCNIYRSWKSEVINLLQNANLTQNKEYCKNKTKLYEKWVKKL